MTKCSMKQQILTIRKGLLQSMYTGKLIQLVCEEHINKLTSVSLCVCPTIDRVQRNSVKMVTNRPINEH